MRLACAGLGITLALALGEASARLLPEEVRGYVFRDGVFQRPPEFAEDTTHNALGLHDLPPTAAPEGKRVLLLGDSYVAALSVPIEHTVGRRLAWHGAEADPRRSLEVIAVGRPGWGQLEELEALRLAPAEWAPELVLTLLLPFNDIRDNLPELDRRADQQLAHLARYRPGWLRLRREDAPLLLLGCSELNRWFSFQLARRARGGVGASEIPLDYLVYAKAPDPAAADPLWLAAWEATESALRATAALARERGARYALALASTPHGILGPEAGLAVLRRNYPRLAERHLDLEGPARRLRAFCEAEGIPFLDLEPLLRAEQERTQVPLHWPRDGHWNEAGNDAAGRELARFVRSL